MKRLKQHWSARPLSWLLTVAMMWPALLFLVAGGQPASAQALTRSAQPLWAVIDFENQSGYGGPEVGRTASDAFVVELGKSNKYDVLSRQETQQGLANSGLTTPLDVIGLQKLGRALQSDAVATGEVAAVTFSNNPRQATVSVIVRVTDSNTGELVNGALAQGTSNPRAISTNDDDALVNEAINNAAFAAVRQITQFNLPKATVLNNEDQDRVLLNKGTRDGLYNGLNMVVTRHGNEVGRIRVSDASADQSDAVVTNRGLGIQPQDLATSIYQLPSYSVTPGHALRANANDVNSDGPNHGSGKRSAFSGVTGVLLAILAGALLISFIRRGNASGSLGGAEVGKPVALEGRADQVGGAGIAPGTDQYTVVYGIPAAPAVPNNFFPISVKLTATVGNIPFQNFIEYHVYRSDFPPVLQDASILGAATGTTTTNTGFGQIPLLAQHSAQPMLLFDDGSDKIAITASKPTSGVGSTNNTTGGTTGGNNNNGGNTLVTVSATGANDTPIPDTGIREVGDRFYYLIEGLYQQQISGGLLNNTNGNTNTNSGTTTGSTTGSTTSGSTTSGTTNSGTTTITNYYLTGRSQTNYVTYLEPVVLNEGDATTGAGGSLSTSTSPDNTIVTVPSTRSADEYVLDLSTDPGFGTKRRLNPDSTGPYTATVTDPRNGNPVTWFLQTGSKNGSLRQLFPTATQIFARIGDRDSRNGSSESVNPYVFTDTIAVPADFVPGAVGSSALPATASVRHHH